MTYVVDAHQRPSRAIREHLLLWVLLRQDERPRVVPGAFFIWSR